MINEPKKKGKCVNMKQLVHSGFDGLEYVSVNIPKPLINRNVLFRSAVSCN